LRSNLKIQIVEDIILKHKIKTETIVSIKKTSKKGNNEIITQYLTSALWCNTSRPGARMTDVKIKNSKMAVQG
jgi:hypothetical protein